MGNPLQSLPIHSVRVPIGAATLERRARHSGPREGTRAVRSRQREQPAQSAQPGGARVLQERGFATLLIDLRTPPEAAVDERTAHLRFDIQLLATRLVAIADWLKRRRDTAMLPVGLFGASTGGGAALVAAASEPENIAAVVSRGGRPDLAGASLPYVEAPTLLIVGGRDTAVIEMNRQAMARMRGMVSLNVSVVVSHPTAAIPDSAATLPADLIVMGTHGLSGFEHRVLGSVTEKVLRRATCPVLTVPPRARATSRYPFTRILCAVDFSEWSAAAVHLASSLARESGAALDLVHVIEWPWHEPPPPILEGLPAEQAAALYEFRRCLVNSATHRLESLVPGAVRDRCAVTARVSHGKAYVELLRAAADQHADLIVLGVPGRNPLDVALFGSTTNHVVRRATCPVLTLRR